MVVAGAGLAEGRAYAGLVPAPGLEWVHHLAGVVDSEDRMVVVLSVWRVESGVQVS